MISQQLVQEISQLEADLCYALADSSRILILYTLHEGPHNVTDIGDKVDIPQSTTSRHLKILRERGLVDTQRDGKSVIYQLVDPRVIEALDLLREVLRDGLIYKANLIEQFKSDA